MPIRLFHLLLAAVTAMLWATPPAVAHPHVWVTMTSEILYAADGTVTGVRHAWTFDDMFSTFAVQGLAAKKKGEFSREELAPLAEVNVSSLKEFDYFSFAKLAGKKVRFSDPKDYFLEYKNGLLTLHFVLPLQAPAKTGHLELEVYDPTYYVDFSFDKGDAVKLAGAPPACKLSLVRPPDAASAPLRPGGEIPLAENYGAQFSNRIAVKCQ